MRLHHLAFRTGDVEALARFYVGVLGLAVRARSGDRSVWLAIGERSMLMIERALEGEPPVGKDTRELVAFEIGAGERAVFVARLASAGVTIESETEHTIYFRDPDGRRIALSHYPF